MSTIFNEFIEKITSDSIISEETKRTYIATLKIIQKFIPKYWSFNFIVYNPDKFIRKVDDYLMNNTNHINPHTKKIYITVIMRFIENKNTDTYQYWIKELEKVQKQIDDVIKSNKPIEKQKKAYISLNEINKIRNNLEIGSLDRLILSLYTDIPPLRSDFGECKILENYGDIDESKNYIILNDKKLILNQFKTKKKYNTLNLDIPEILVSEIRESIKKNPREYLFLNREKKPYTNKRAFNLFINGRLKKILNKPNFTLLMFRHIYITDNKIHEKSILEQEQIAQKMADSISLQQRYSFKCWNKEQ